jgi:hypothetical protein
MTTKRYVILSEDAEAVKDEDGEHIFTSMEDVEKAIEADFNENRWGAAKTIDDYLRRAPLKVIELGQVYDLAPKDGLRFNWNKKS